LLVQKKVTKEKDTLASAVCRHPCRQTARAGYGVRREHILCSRRTRRPPAGARAARGHFLRLLAAAERGPGRAKRGSPCRRSGLFRRPRESGDLAPLRERLLN